MQKKTAENFFWSNTQRKNGFRKKNRKFCPFLPFFHAAAKILLIINSKQPTQKLGSRETLGFAWYTNPEAFGGHFGAFCGHIVVLEGPKGLVDIGKSSCMWSVATISLRLAILNWFQDGFGRKKGCFWP